MAKPAVVLVGADKGGVGKTTVARTLVDYFVAHNIPTRTFDTESPKGTLKRFHPDLTTVVDITATADQMKIFDTLTNTDAQVTVIDIRAGQLLTTLRALRDIGFLDAAKKNQLSFAIFHILGPSVASLDEIGAISEFTGGAHYFQVKNFINNTTFFDWEPDAHEAYFKKIKDLIEITVPKLNEMACEQVELAGVPYLSFVANKGPSGQSSTYSFVLRGYVRHWLGNVWAEFDRVKLLDLVGAEAQRKAATRQAAAGA